MADRLTRYQAMIVGAYTGVSCGPFGDVHGYAEKMFGRPIPTNEFTNEQTWLRLREAAEADFLDICFDIEAAVSPSPDQPNPVPIGPERS